MAKRPSPTSPLQNTPNEDVQSLEKLKQSAVYIIGAILLALAGYFGWTYFHGSGNKEDTVAADKFTEIEAANDALLNQPKPDAEALKKLNADIDALVAEHGSTVYAWQALMIKARNAVDANEKDVAIEALKKAMTIDLHDAGLHSITQLRYATVLLDSGKVDEAMTQASKDVPVAFEASQQELLGDIYMAKKDKEKAIRSYKNAWSLLSKRAEERPFLRLKLENLGINPKPIEQPPQIVNLPDEQSTVAEQSSIEDGTDTNTNVTDTNGTEKVQVNSEEGVTVGTSKENASKESTFKESTFKESTAESFSK